ncbi:MAG: hypothetical protein NW208_07495 [Bryobacter sp.]|nr:hypothetical protein [Bryobacter sp.]
MKKSNRLGPYLLSLPERTLRSLTALSAGFVREAGEVVLPLSFRRSRIYHSMVDQFLRFLIEDVGKVEGAYTDQDALPADFLLRRSAGNGIEWLSLAVFHASPVWVLAGLSDLSGAGGKVLREIALTLEAQGLLSGGASVRSMGQLLEALERGSGHLAETVNTPPLNLAALRAEWQKLQSSVAQPPNPELVEQQWSELKSTATRLNRTPWEISTAVALSTLRTAHHLVAEPWREHYRATLHDLESQGFPTFVEREMKPYWKAALASFSRTRRSSTEALIIKTKRHIPK